MSQSWACRVAVAAAVLWAGLLPAPHAAAGPAATGPNGQVVTVSRSSGLNPAGTTVTVRGSGFDLNKGIYVAFCVNKGTGQMPTPCLGGVDMQGSSGASAWISSNPPSYGEGLAKPFTNVGGKGSFEVQLTVKAKDAFTNCLDPKAAPRGCVIGTRADHTRTADRSADVLIPVTFASGSSTTSPTPAPTTAPTSASTNAPTSGSTSAPTAEPSDESSAPVKKKQSPLANTGGIGVAVVVVAVVLLGGGAVLLLAGRRKRTASGTETSGTGTGTGTGTGNGTGEKTA